ncbi:two-component system sensor histidine kinase YesM [Paenibacillus endophyticus]|uniref:histidine kinase n=1 Tax=Paenibacillus endophyticus TaxID=1294268 RepID=A0A7W5GDA2_9BACL|nr:sensor histidine kinase [Paenibacillus endophyticus]MBB3155740.1 two-component system sensor histidine kinase YesM [Paenibacillus endophyticus]
MLYSLRSRLMVAFSILLIFPFVSLVYILTSASANLIKNSLEISASQTIEQYASHVTTLMKQLEDIGNQVLGSSITQTWLADLRNSEALEREELLAKRRVRDFLSSYAVNNSNGISISLFNTAKGGLWKQDRTYEQQPWFLDYKEQNVKWTGSHLDEDQPDESMRNRSVNGYLLPLVELQTLTSVGIVKVNYPTSVLRDPLERIHFGETGRVFLLDIDGQSVLGQQFTGVEAILQEGISELGKFRKTNQAGKLERENGVFAVRNQGKPYLVFYEELPDQNWTIMGVVPERELYAKLNRIKETMLLVSGILLVIVLVVAFGLSKSVTNPLTRMARSMKLVKRGEFDEAIKQMPNTQRGHSEIGYVTGAFGQMTHRLKYLIETEYETNLRRKNAEYKALLLQINPHFFNNTLEIISGLAAMKRNDLVMDATESLGQMMRYSLDLSSDQVWVPEELDYIRDYLFILKLRYDDRLQVRIEEAPGARELKMPKFILQPLVENAVKYSLENGEKAIVELGAEARDGWLYLTISDNGIGMNGELAAELQRGLSGADTTAILHTEGNSIGLRNVLARCRVQYGDAFEVHIASSPDSGTTITMRLPASRS